MGKEKRKRPGSSGGAPRTDGLSRAFRDLLGHSPTLSTLNTQTGQASSASAQVRRNKSGGRGGQRRTIMPSWKRKRETEGEEKRYRDTNLSAIHPANIYPGLPRAPGLAVEEVEEQS